MVPTGQTVVAALLALGLARGPSESPAPGPAQTAADSAGSPDAAAEPEPSSLGEAEMPAESDVPAEPDAPAESDAPDEPAAPSTEKMPAASASEAPAADPLEEPDVEGSEDDDAWDEDDDAWDGEDEAWDDDYDPLRDSPEAVASQRRIAGGAVVVGLGAMVSLGGLAMAVSDPCARPAGNSCSPASRNRAALTMALPGLATVAVGGVMLALGIRQRRALRVDANLNASGAGVTFRGRF
ncbi:MAG: hypothetical protein ACRBN8_16970 [Nannocystales bacterium]